MLIAMLFYFHLQDQVSNKYAVNLMFWEVRWYPFTITKMGYIPIGAIDS